MIDTWFFAAICFGFLALCALMMVIHGPGLNNRLVSFTAAITIAAAAALVFGIASGDLFFVDAAIIVTVILFVGTLVYAKLDGSDE